MKNAREPPRPFARVATVDATSTVLPRRHRPPLTRPSVPNLPLHSARGATNQVAYRCPTAVSIPPGQSRARKERQHTLCALSMSHPAIAFHRSAFRTRSRLMAVATSAVASSSALQTASVPGSATIFARAKDCPQKNVCAAAAGKELRRREKARERCCIGREQRDTPLLPKKQYRILGAGNIDTAHVRSTKHRARSQADEELQQLHGNRTAVSRLIRVNAAENERRELCPLIQRGVCIPNRAPENRTSC